LHNLPPHLKRSKYQTKSERQEKEEDKKLGSWEAW